MECEMVDGDLSQVRGGTKIDCEPCVRLPRPLRASDLAHTGLLAEATVLLDTV